jgi:hypothetical protein
MAYAFHIAAIVNRFYFSDEIENFEMIMRHDLSFSLDSRQQRAFISFPINISVWAVSNFSNIGSIISKLFNFFG